MQKGVRLLLMVCLLVTLGIICLQVFWLNNLYTLNKDRFEKDINLAVEDAIKKELTARNDRIERLLFNFMMDTSEIRITSKFNPKDGKQMYQALNVKDPNDDHWFSHKQLHAPILSQTDPYKEKVAMTLARSLREEDLDRHIIFYRTQNIGNYLADKTEELSFDTAKLRPFLKQSLQERNISEHFVFSLTDADNTLNRNHFPDSLTKLYPVISKAFPTYRNKAGENYVRAYFLSPSNYLFSRSIGLVLG
ncbi:MAG TPA: hypothetical protein VEB42_11045, partial [Chitinophagaceae bacterium]|nr:hypothetical protein [Chitinophagaceae bacterium]